MAGFAGLLVSGRRTGLSTGAAEAAGTTELFATGSAGLAGFVVPGFKAGLSEADSADFAGPPEGFVGSEVLEMFDFSL